MTKLLFLALLIIPFLATGKDKIPVSIYEFKVLGKDGKTIDFSKFRGKKILIVNTPLHDNLNHQYGELDSLYKKYKDRLVIVGFLMEDFSKPPLSKAKVLDAQPKHYDVSFPLAAKITVFGDSCAPVYKWLKQKKYNKLKENEVGWDFQKYLINEKGKLIALFNPRKSVWDVDVIDAIEGNFIEVKK